MTAERRPNVLPIIADDHRHGAIGAQGDRVVQTSALDRLMQEGVSFEWTYHFGARAVHRARAGDRGHASHVERLLRALDVWQRAVGDPQCRWGGPGDAAPLPSSP